MRAQAQSDRSLALALSAQSRELSDKNDQRALLLAVEAVKATSTEGYALPAARAALQLGLTRVTGVGLPGHRDYPTLAEFSQDENTLATAAFDNEVRVWDIANPKVTGLRKDTPPPRVATDIGLRQHRRQPFDIESSRR